MLFGVYGKERDAFIARSKVVINHHYFSSELFEIVRVFYLLANSVAVVAEVNKTTSIDPVYLNGVYATPYEGLVDACVELVRNQDLRTSLQKNAFDTISKLDQSSIIAALI